MFISNLKGTICVFLLTIGLINSTAADVRIRGGTDMPTPTPFPNNGVGTVVESCTGDCDKFWDTNIGLELQDQATATFNADCVGSCEGSPTAYLNVAHSFTYSSHYTQKLIADAFIGEQGSITFENVTHNYTGLALAQSYLVDTLHIDTSGGPITVALTYRYRAFLGRDTKGFSDWYDPASNPSPLAKNVASFQWTANGGLEGYRTNTTYFVGNANVIEETIFFTVDPSTNGDIYFQFVLNNSLKHLGAVYQYLDFSISSPVSSTSESGTIYSDTLPSVPADGDITLDGIVDAADVLLGQQVLNNQATLSALQWEHGDVAPIINNSPTPDGQFTVGDLLIIQRKALGVINY